MQENKYSIHACGNGNLISYHHDLDIIQFFTSSYSSPSIGSISVSGIDGGYLKREEGTMSYSNDQIDDFVSYEKSFFVRSIKEHMVHSFNFHNYVIVKDISFRYGPDIFAYEIAIKAGTYAYNNYPIANPIYSSIVFIGVKEEDIEFNGQTIVLSGKGTFAIVGGGSYPEYIRELDDFLGLDIEKEKEESKRKWGDYLSSLPKHTFNIPYGDTLGKIIESVTLCIKSQQDKGGGVLAGYPYHLGYVRDLFGVVKGMLAIGLKDEAFRVLAFFLRVFNEEGRVNNAHGLRMRGIKHIHENDDVEITGYLTLMFFDCYDLLEEESRLDFLYEYKDFLAWTLRAQMNEIIDGMLPFNGDETYIAGGILPRNTIFDGSAEATLLFIEGARRYIKETESLKDFHIDGLKEALDDCQDNFYKNFMEDKKLKTNNPKRALKGMKAFRYGVCEGYCGYFGYLKLGQAKLYLCTDCQRKEALGHVFRNDKEVYYLKSVLFMPFFIGSSFLKKEDILDEIYKVSLDFLQDGKLPSSPKSSRNLGYDYGFFLSALNQILVDFDSENLRYRTFLEAALKLYEKTIDLVDRSYTYCEYYDNDRPAGTQYRPWESAINARALIDFARNYKRLGL